MTEWRERTDYNRRWREQRVREGHHRRYRSSMKGIANHLTHVRGYQKEQAEVIAKHLVDPQAACEICGITNRTLRMLVRRNFPFPRGTLEQNRRLTPDNLRPGERHDIVQTRILCFGCNTYRGPDLRSDEETLRWAIREWTQRLPTRNLRWLRVPGGTTT